MVSEVSKVSEKLAALMRGDGPNGEKYEVKPLGRKGMSLERIRARIVKDIENHDEQHRYPAMPFSVLSNRYNSPCRSNGVTFVELIELMEEAGEAGLIDVRGGGRIIIGGGMLAIAREFKKDNGKPFDWGPFAAQFRAFLKGETLFQD